MWHDVAQVDTTDMPEERHGDKRPLRQIRSSECGGDHLNRASKVDIVEWEAKFGAKSSDTRRDVIIEKNKTDCHADCHASLITK